MAESFILWKWNFMVSPRTTKAQQAFKKLRKELVMGQWSDSKRISMRKLADRLGMSVVPVSEAVRRLEQEGLIEVQPQSGIYLKPLTDRQKLELHLVRQALEIQAVRIFMQAQITVDWEPFRKLARKIATYLQKKNIGAAAYYDWEFHKKMVALAGSEFLSVRHEQIAARAMVLTPSLEIRWIEPSNDDHLIIVDAFESGDVEKSQAVIRNHLKVEKSFINLNFPNFPNKTPKKQ